MAKVLAPSAATVLARGCVALLAFLGGCFVAAATGAAACGEKTSEPAWPAAAAPLLASAPSLAPAQVFAPTPAPLRVRVATWNVFDLPEQIFPVASSHRLKQVAHALQTACGPIDLLDAVVFTELYVERDRRTVLAQLAQLGLPHSAVLGPKTIFDRLRLAGVVVASRWPIDKVVTRVAPSGCHGFDCLALKGSVYARLRKLHAGQRRAIHLFGTHFYFGGVAHGADSRRVQARDLAVFVAAQGIESNEPVILAGDLNANWSEDGPEILRLLGAYPLAPQGQLAETFVGADHAWAGSPRQSASERCARVAHQTPGHAPASGKWLDYVVSLTPGIKPTASHMQAYPVFGTPFMLSTPPDAGCWIDALSDHAPVVGNFCFDAAVSSGGKNPSGGW